MPNPHSESLSPVTSSHPLWLPLWTQCARARFHWRAPKQTAAAVRSRGFNSVSLPARWLVGGPCWLLVPLAQSRSLHLHLVASLSLSLSLHLSLAWIGLHAPPPPLPISSLPISGTPCPCLGPLILHPPHRLHIHPSLSPVLPPAHASLVIHPRRGASPALAPISILPMDCISHGPSITHTHTMRTTRAEAGLA